MVARSPVITGLGIVAAPGCGVGKNWEAIRSGTSGLKPLTLFSSPRYGQLPVGEAPGDLTGLGAPAHGSRSDQLGWLAAREAIAAAGIDFRNCAEQSGVVLGCSVGGSFGSEKFLTDLIKHGKIRPRPTRFHECVSIVDLIANQYGLFGPSLAVSTACSSGALAIATAAEMIQAGEADVMLAGGADSLARMTWGGFHSLLLVDAVGCRPFDAGRAGTSLGEGAGVLVLEAEETARRRGAKILARLSGWGASCDARHATSPHPEGAGAAAAMQSALRRAGLPASAINYVNAHGTGTRDNDLAESKALKTIFGERLPPVSSTKRFFGHTLAASGAIEAVICVEALRHQEIPPNPGFTTVDPTIGLEPVTQLRSASLSHVMSNSFGFGGNNAVLIFSRPEMPVQTRAARRTTIAVTGMGVVGPGAVTEREIEPPLPAGTVTAFSCGTLADTTLLTPSQRRRLGRMIQMAIIAARRSHVPDPAQRLAVTMGTGFGCLEEGAMFIENFISKDEREAMPSRFSGSVHNAAAAQIAIDLKAHALNSAPTAGEISFECALWQGAHQLAVDEADVALVGAVDELNKYPLSIGKRWGYWTAQTRPGEGAMVASLTLPEKAATPLARVTSVRLGRYRQPFDAEREAEWIATAVDLTAVNVVLSGAKGWPALDAKYAAVVAALSARAGRTLEHQTYKQHCGEFHAASGYGFSVAVELVRQGNHGVLLYTLSPRGGKAICCVQP
ncbi:MAG: beta-ketoacyl synthase N-terminal-like domain-containing protein [Limisphaerales bacterium]